jgi:hypothetical protein
LLRAHAGAIGKPGNWPKPVPGFPFPNRSSENGLKTVMRLMRQVERDRGKNRRVLPLEFPSETSGILELAQGNSLSRLLIVSFLNQLTLVFRGDVISAV